MLGSIAENERLKIKRRQKEGIEAAKKKNVKFGRPEIPKPENWDFVISEVKSGQIRPVDAMKYLGLSHSQYYYMRKNLIPESDYNVLLYSFLHFLELIFKNNFSGGTIMAKTKRGHNEGSIRQREDGRWEIRVTAGIDFKTGKPKRISHYAKTKAEAVKLLHEVEYNIHINEMVDPTSTKLIDWLRIWLETYMRNSLKQSTYTSYAGYINNHFAPAFPSLKLKDLTSKLLQEFYNYKLTEECLSPKTIANMHRCPA